jgi:cytochrome c peroxidase
LDSSISCGSCHAQTHGFADHNITLSLGVGGALGKRNSPALSNLAWYPNFMWDGGINHIETFSIGPITNSLEMKETIAHVVQKLNQSSYYKTAFKKAYQIDEVTDQAMLRALAQFMAMMVSAESKYDLYYQGKSNFSASEENGYQLFKANCATCHKEPLTTDFSYRNNGLDMVFEDLGRALITLDPNDQGKFKVPSLRNVALTYPYMHDGRFFTLEQVIEHYSTGIVQSPNLDSNLPNGFNFSTQEKQDLLSFLKTLTDYNYIGNLKLSEK